MLVDLPVGPVVCGDVRHLRVRIAALHGRGVEDGDPGHAGQVHAVTVGEMPNPCPTKECSPCQITFGRRGSLISIADRCPGTGPTPSTSFRRGEPALVRGERQRCGGAGAGVEELGMRAVGDVVDGEEATAHSSGTAVPASSLRFLLTLRVSQVPPSMPGAVSFPTIRGLRGS